MTLAPRSGRTAPWIRLAACLGALLAMAGCAHRQYAQLPPTQEAAQYAAHARGNYTPPGPPEDPWGPYIVEAAARFDVPDRWIREVMRQESGGNLYENGQLITSGAGAMGLMQVMPDTYDGLRQRYSLGDDPYDPHNNILAGAAYIREMYDIYGTPGFLAAYNAGPKRLDDYLTHNRPLPDETRHYVARIGPNITGVAPEHPSQAQQYAMNQIPLDIPPGPRYPRARRSTRVAVVPTRPGRSEPQTGEIQVAELPAPPRPVPPPEPSAKGGHGFHLIQRAMADTLPVHSGGPTTGKWAIQVGAFVNQQQARDAAQEAKGHAKLVLASARPFVGTVHQAKGTLYRARLTGLSREAAIEACEKLATHRGFSCMVVSPEAQS